MELNHSTITLTLLYRCMCIVLNVSSYAKLRVFHAYACTREHTGVFVLPVILPFVISHFSPELQAEEIG